jgi:hypothetical protein
MLCFPLYIRKKLLLYFHKYIIFHKLNKGVCMAVTLAEILKTVKEHGAGDAKSVPERVKKRVYERAGGRIVNGQVEHLIPQNPEELDPNDPIHRDYIEAMGLSLAQKHTVTSQQILDAIFSDIDPTHVPSVHDDWNLIIMDGAANNEMSNRVTIPLAMARKSLEAAARVAYKQIEEEKQAALLKFKTVPALNLPRIPAIKKELVLSGGVVTGFALADAVAKLEADVSNSCPQYYKADIPARFKHKEFLAVAFPCSGTEEERIISIDVKHEMAPKIEKMAELYGVLKNAFDQASEDITYGRRYEHQTKVELPKDFAVEFSQSAAALDINVRDIIAGNIFKENGAWLVETDKLKRRMGGLKKQIEQKANHYAGELSAFHAAQEGASDEDAQLYGAITRFAERRPRAVSRLMAA